MTESSCLCLYRFEPGAAFEGGVLGALERMELLGEADLLDALLVAREPATGELQAVDLRIAAGDDRFVALTDFRLDPARRRALTEQTLAEHPGGVEQAVIEAIAATLDPGGALFAALTEGEPTALRDALARAGARLLIDEAADADQLADVAERIRRAAGAG